MYWVQGMVSTCSHLLQPLHCGITEGANRISETQTKMFTKFMLLVAISVNVLNVCLFVGLFIDER